MHYSHATVIFPHHLVCKTTNIVIAKVNRYVAVHTQIDKPRI